jgi:hypothetical protein
MDFIRYIGEAVIYGRLVFVVTIDLIADVYLYYKALFNLEAGPEFRYEPGIGYSYYDPTEDISEAHKLHPYIGLEQFIKDWIDTYPQG